MKRSETIITVFFSFFKRMSGWRNRWLAAKSVSTCNNNWGTESGIGNWQLAMSNWQDGRRNGRLSAWECWEHFSIAGESSDGIFGFSCRCRCFSCTVASFSEKPACKEFFWNVWILWKLANVLFARLLNVALTPLFRSIFALFSLEAFALALAVAFSFCQ